MNEGDVRIMSTTTRERRALRTVPYRYDLDGLRGIAIAFVVLFHVFVGRVSGGVDVFLLLSGYFFLGSQLRYAGRDDASANPWWPIWRTARRLLPGLLVVLGATAVMVLWFVPQLRRVEIIDQFRSSLLYVQNWELAAQDADYAVASEVVSPMQHLWSMAVQGQFYLMAIALAMVIIWLRRSGRDLSRWVGPALAGVTVVSFLYAWYLHGQDQALAYYSTWARMWQLSLGGLLALYAARVQVAPWLKEAFTWVGLAMVLSTGLLFDGAALFPGPAALYPIGGAVLIVLGGGRLAGVLGNRFMRWLGDIAYPLYLWHWPILIIALVVLDHSEVTLWLGVATVLASLVLADLTHRIVEKPLRQHGKRPVRGERRARQAWAELSVRWAPRGRAFAAVGLVGIMVALLGVQGAWQARLRGVDGEQIDPVLHPGAAALVGASVPKTPARPDPALLGAMGSPIWGGDCISRFEHDPGELRVDVRGDDCIFGDREADFEVYLVGGSHADQWIMPLDALGREHGFRITPLVRQSCPTFVTELDGGLFEEDCQQFNEQVIERLAQVQPDLVVSTTTRPPIQLGSAREELPASYLTFWEFLAEQGIPFLGLRDNPWKVDEEGMGLSVPICFADLGDPDVCGIARDEFYLPEDPAAAYLDPLPGMRAVDTSDWFCMGEHCPPVIGNIYVYRDSNHLSNAYAATLAPFLWEEMRRFLPR